MSALVALLLGVLVAESPAAPVLQHIACIPMHAPAAVGVEPSFPRAPSPSVLVTSISPLQPERVYAVLDAAPLVEGESRNATILLHKELWPNQVTLAPEEVFKKPTLMVTNGFLLPGKNPGAIEMTMMDSCLRFSVTHRKQGYFYTKAIWTDMDGDGRLDILTARATKPLLSKGHGQMLWLRQPKHPMKIPWEEHILMDGPDREFLFANFGLSSFGGSIPQIVVANLFGDKDLSLYICDVAWANCTHPARVTIDDEVGPFYNIHKIDLNGDGRDDILASSFRVDGQGAVLAYETPANGFTGNWTRHVLSGGYQPLKKAELLQPGDGAPGTLAPFHLPSQPNAKPWILVGGESSGLVHLLRPCSQDPSDWCYDIQTILEKKGAVAGVAAFDVNSDGLMDFFIADHSGNSLEVFTLMSEGADI